MTDWIEHDGNLPSLNPLTLVHARFRDGDETRVAETVGYWDRCWFWDRRFPRDNEIVAYRVVPV